MLWGLRCLSSIIGRIDWTKQQGGSKKNYSFYRYIETFVTLSYGWRGSEFYHVHHHSLHQASAPLPHFIYSICISPTIRFDHFSVEYKDVQFFNLELKQTYENPTKKIQLQRQTFPRYLRVDPPVFWGLYRRFWHRWYGRVSRHLV